MAGLQPLGQLGTQPYWTLAEPRFAASHPLRVTCGGIRARHDSLLGLLINPVAAITPPVAAEASTTQTCVLRRFTGRDSIRGRAAPGTLPRGLEEESEGRCLACCCTLLLYPQKKPVSDSKQALDLGWS
jgi:hypothetical protein